MTHGERYALHCPLCGEEIEFQMTQAGQEALTATSACPSCGQQITLSDHRAMNQPMGKTGIRQNMDVVLSDVGDSK